MASGPEHYREAERLAGVAEHTRLYGEGDAASMFCLSRALVHATLALAAAMADPWGEADWKQALQ
jgi:hypothetical protein